MRLLQALGAALPLGLALGASTPNNLVVHEKRDVVPAHQWSKKSVAPHDLVFPVRLAISPRNVELGHEMLMNIASPNSPNFGQHWTPENVRDFFSPTRSTVSIIKTWLTSSGIHHSRLNLHGGRGHINFHATIGEMEKLLGTEYQLFENVETGDLTVSCDQYHVPESIQEHIDFISPTIGFDVNSVPALKKRSLTKRSHKPHWQGGLAGKPAVSKPMTWWPSDIDSLSNCSGLVTPACIKALDSIPQRNEAVFEGNDLGVYEFGDHYDQEDLNLFFAKYTPETPQGTHPSLDSIDGGTDPVNVTDAGGESVLDFELSFPIVYPQPIQVLQTLDNFDANTTDGIWDPFLDALDGSLCTYDGGDNTTFDPTFPSAGYNHSEQCGVFKPTNVMSLTIGVFDMRAHINFRASLIG